MQSFSVCLKQYLDKYNISYTNAAKMCGIDRTLLGRYGNGIRMPQSKKKVDHLAQSLQMSQQDREKLLRAYQRTKVCREYHINYELLEAVIDEEYQLKEVVPISFQVAETIAEEQAKSLETKSKVLKMITNVLEDAAWVKVMANPEYPELQELLQNMHTALSEQCDIEQVIGLMDYDWKYGEEKVRNLQIILPLLLQKKTYQVYYHYQLAHKIAEKSTKLNYVITDKGMVLFEHGLETGFFTNQQQPCLYYAEMYERMKSICRLFAQGGEKQYFQWKKRPDKTTLRNSQSDKIISLICEGNEIWMVSKKQNCAACIRESGLVQLLREFFFPL